MNRAELETSLYTRIKKDYYCFSNSMKENGNYDFFRSLDRFTQRIAFLKSRESHGLNFYRRYAYTLVFGNTSTAFSFKAYDRAVEIGFIYYSKTPREYIKTNEMLLWVGDDVREKVLGMTVYKDFKKMVKNNIDSVVADVITTVMFGREY